MTDDTKRDDRPDEGASSSDGAPQATKSAWYHRFLDWRWLAVLIVVSLILHGMGLATYRLLGTNRGPEPTPEVALGTYLFLAAPREPGQVESASFSLHIALLEHVEAPARQRLRDRQHRVRQNVEELLRRAHGGDFEDPTLAGLKRQLQEQINDTLGMRAIADVIVTNLELTHRQPSAAPTEAQTAEAGPRTEPPSG
jgi:flagellar basal body-associated protein FliL